MSIPNSNLARFASDANEIFGGTLSDVWVVPGGIPLPTTQSLFPKHGLSLQGSNPNGFPQSKRFKNGASTVSAVAWVKTVKTRDNSSIIAGVTTLTVGTGVYLFVASGATGFQINIGGSATATATAIAAKLTADAGTIGIATAIAATDTVTITGLGTGADFTFKTNTPVGFVLKTTVTGTTAIVGATANATIKVCGSKFVTGSINQIVIMLLINGLAEKVRFQVDTPNPTGFTASQMQNLIAQLICATLIAGITGDTPIDGCRIFSSNPFNSVSDIQTAMADFFGTASNISVSSNIITITAGAVGSSGNFLTLGCVLLPSLPSPLIDVDENGYPQGDFIPDHCGAQDGFQAAINPTTQDVQASNFTYRFKRVTTGQTLDIQFKAFQDYSLDVAQIGLNKAAMSYNNSDSVLLFGGAAVPDVFGLILTSPSKFVVGSFDVLVLYSNETQALTINRAKNQVNGFDIKFSPNAFNRQADPIGYMRQARPTGIC